MKICFANRVNDKSEQALVMGLSQRGHQIVCIGENRDQSLARLEELGIKVYRTSFKNRLDLSAFRLMRQIFRNEKFDLIYAPTGRPLTLALMTCHARDTKFVTYRGTLTNLSYYNPADLLSHLNPRVKRIITNSFAVKQYLLSIGVPPDRLQVVYKGHDFSWYQTEQRASLGLAPQMFVIGSVANFRPMKGGQFLIQAFAELIKETPAHLCLVGDILDPEIPKIIAKLNLTKHITCMPFQDNPFSLMKSFSVSVMPSIAKESLSRSIVESVALRVPVIVTDVGGMSEMIHNHQTGLVVPPSNVRALTEALSYVSNNLSEVQTWAERAYQELSTKFELDQYITQMEEAFMNTVDVSA